MTKAFPQIESWLTIFKKRVESALDAEATWREFRKDVVGTTSDAAAERYIRINPRTKNRIPKMDDKSQIDTLQEDIISNLRTHGSQTKIKNIAQRLVASSFYFEKSCPSRVADDHIIVQGKWSVQRSKPLITLPRQHSVQICCRILQSPRFRGLYTQASAASLSAVLPHTGSHAR
jgi:hypothetical protein